MVLLRVQLLTPLAKAPVRASSGAAGYDLCSAYDGVVPKRGKALLKTDIAIAVPPNCYGRVAPRSGLTLKNGIDVGAGVIDEDYRGNVGVILFNHSDDDFIVKAGDRIAQLIMERIEVAEVTVCESIDDTARGAGGFGSTGVSSSVAEGDIKKARIE